MSETEPVDYEAARAAMVSALRARGVASDPRVFEAFASVPREVFVPEELRAAAYEDRALPLIEGQTISQPTMIAIMLDALECQPEDRVLEIGGGCGYAAALLSRLAREVHTIEIRPALAALAVRALAEAGIRNVTVHVGDGHAGLPQYAPFHRTLVSAAAEAVPGALLEQLAPGGRIAIPIEDLDTQALRVGQKLPDGTMEWSESVPCLFVPLVGD